MLRRSAENRKRVLDPDEPREYVLSPPCAAGGGKDGKGYPYTRDKRAALKDLIWCPAQSPNVSHAISQVVLQG